ncbi:dnaJ homolog subfamily C member 16 isoform X2 [Nematostella vectensis]|uniref:dnaJ homolog subfamily C member 16 isoform X2 n=1 Tax=Nematostella vectensis TaxID=45351 RepID=UPI00138F9FEB|nr:dnaJ homolog subfamily C member 16 isoform X2 [Nematostella vectensis]
MIPWSSTVLVLIIAWSFPVRSLDASDDPYDILGVSRTASPNDVKRSYKKLARNWHPDKNNDPTAQERFIKINQAYEILSDEGKRRDFDNFGHEAPNRQRSQGQPFFDAHSGFSFFFNDNPFSHSSQSNADHVTAKAFDTLIIPASYEKPYILEVISNWCMACMQIESVWESTANDLKSLGVGIGVINVNRSPRLADQLSIDGVPRIIGVLNGKLTYYNQRMSPDGIKEFTNGLFPYSLVHRVSSKTSDIFLKTDDNKPKVLLFSPKSSPSLLYNLVAFSNQERLSFGFVSMSGQDGEKLRRKFRVMAKEPTVMIFKEESAVPEVVFEATDLKSGKLREMVSANKYLNLPRLTTQKIFDELCPDERFRSQRKLCVILFTKRGSHDNEKAALRNFAKDSHFPDDRVHFVYIHEDVQTRIVSAMREGLDAATSKNRTALKLAILWNPGNGEARYTWLPGGWYVTRSTALVDKLKHLIEDVIGGSGKLKYSTRLPVLYNEDAPSPQARIVAKLRDFISFVLEFFARKDSSSIITLVLGLGLIIVMSIFLPQGSFVSAICARSCLFKKLWEAPPGQLTVAILLDAVTTEDAVKSPLLKAFDEVVHSCSGKYSILFKYVWLSIPDNLEWCTEVMEVNKFGEVIPGTVLAMNGPRKYVMTFKPTDLTKSQYFKSQGGDLMGFNDSDESDEEGHVDEWSAYERKRQKVLSLSLRRELPRWLEKLSEGLIKKVKLDEWPVMD